MSHMNEEKMLAAHAKTDIIDLINYIDELERRREEVPVTLSDGASSNRTVNLPRAGVEAMKKLHEERLAKLGKKP